VSFARPELLWLALLALGELAIAALRTPRLRASVQALAGPRRRGRAGSLYSVFSLWGSVAAALYVCSAALALAGPSWGREGSAAERLGLEAALVLDVSRSMEARDAAPSRLAAAKSLARSLIKAAGQEASGGIVSLSLVAAKGDGVLLVPMTEDGWALDEALDYADPETMTARGTNLERGIRTGLESFSSAGAANKILVLFTDGGELEGDARAAAEAARREKVRLLVVGLGGSEGVEVPGPDGAPLLDARGLVARSALEEERLRSVAAAADGRYLDGLDARTSQLLASELSAARGGGVRIEYEEVDRSALFASIALAFLVVSILAELLSLRGATK